MLKVAEVRVGLRVHVSVYGDGIVTELIVTRNLTQAIVQFESGAKEIFTATWAKPTHEIHHYVDFEKI